MTKILHRKRPDLVPINDSLVREFYVKKRAWDYVDLGEGNLVRSAASGNERTPVDGCHGSSDACWSTND